jgi:hypothetical protein
MDENQLQKLRVTSSIILCEEQTIEGKRACWALKLFEYGYEIQQIAGKRNHIGGLVSQKSKEKSVQNSETISANSKKWKSVQGRQDPS